jgi:hypothetical protein
MPAPLFDATVCSVRRARDDDLVCWLDRVANLIKKEEEEEMEADFNVIVTADQIFHIRQILMMQN